MHHNNLCFEVKILSNQQTNKNEKQNSKSINSRQDSGSKYHKEHAGNVEGYGEIYLDAKGLSNVTESKDQ